MLGKARACGNAERFITSTLCIRCVRCPLALQRGDQGAAMSPNANARAALTA